MNSEIVSKSVNKNKCLHPKTVTMEKQENIHFISPGEHIHDTYPLVINKDHITRTYVIVEKEICKDSPNDDQFRRSRKEAIRNSIHEVKEISKKAKINYQTIFIDTVTLEAIRDAVYEIYRKFPKAEYSFNISGGTKIHSLGLFWMSLWINSKVYHTPTDSTINTLFIPRMHLQEISDNPNYIEIMKILDNKGKGKEPGSHIFVSRRILSSEMQTEYHPKPDPDNDKIKRKLSEGGLTKFLWRLQELKLILEQFQEGRRREKEYLLTADGDFALKIFLVQQKTEPKKK